MPIDKEDYDHSKSAGAQFMGIRDIPIGKTWECQLHSMDKNTRLSNVKFAIKGKDYNYRITLTDPERRDRLLDVNSASAIKQFVQALYPDGFEGGMSPCVAKLTRRAERKQNESELVVERVRPLDEAVPF